MTCGVACLILASPYQAKTKALVRLLPLVINCFAKPISSKSFCHIGGIFNMPRPAKMNLSGMDVSALMALRSQIDDALGKRRTELEQQLKELGRAVDGAARDGRRGSSPLAGKKIAAKYRGPSGETWAGRGQKPKWLVEAIKGGKKAEDFLIAKSTEGGRRKTKRRKK
jgi:DNA-binding protein H-NS